jgi:hypothetical protein
MKIVTNSKIFPETPFRELVVGSLKTAHESKKCSGKPALGLEI